MNEPGSNSGQYCTRRHTLRLGLALGAGLGMGRIAPRSALAQATPDVSPATGGGYARPELVIDAASLTDRRDDPDMIVVALMPPEEFARGHIPGSLQLDWPALEIIDTSDAAIADWRPEMEHRFAALGVTPKSTVVTYDGETLFATRPWWVLRYLGHEDARVLNGGLAAWEQAGGVIATDVAPATPPAAPATEPFPATSRPEVLAQLEEVRASLDDPNVVIVDARTPEEYAQGHIPGAVNVNFPRNADAEAPKIWRPQDELRAMYEEVGVTPDKRIIPYCSTGVRSSVTFFTLRLIGYDNVALYTGSWEEWSNHPETPKATGA
ncbi:MAG: sulfurtransferase [Chloroflexi bacterium]|nr:sulfurtransferase [Chloroflexota bacterium]